MSDLKLTDDWATGIYQLEEADLVLGGPDGIDNRQAKELGARTNYLRKHGIPQWLEAIAYDVDCYVKHGGSLWRSKRVCMGKEPGKSADDWEVLVVPLAQLDTRYHAKDGTLAWGKITGTPSTLAGYGITDEPWVQPLGALSSAVASKADKGALDQSVTAINQRISTETEKLLTNEAAKQLLPLADAEKTYLPAAKAAETYLAKEDAKTQYLAQANAETFVSEHAASRYAGIIALNGNSDFMDVAGNPPLPLNMGIGLSNFSTLYDASLIDVIPRSQYDPNPAPYHPDAEELLQMVYGKPTREFSPEFRILKITRKAVGVPNTYVFHIPNQHIVCATDISFCLYAKTTGAGEKKWGWGIGDTGGKWKQCVTRFSKSGNPLYYFHLDFYDEGHSGGAVGDTLLLALPVVFNTLWPERGSLHGKPYCPTDAAYRINRAIAAGTTTNGRGQ